MEISLTKSASGVWFCSHPHPIKTLRDLGFSHPLPSTEIDAAKQVLVKAGHRVTLKEPVDPAKEDKERKRRESKVRDLALAIAADLFTESDGRHADRLVMEHTNGTQRVYGGGWGLGPMANRIEMMLLDNKFPFTWME